MTLIANYVYSQFLNVVAIDVLILSGYCQAIQNWTARRILYLTVTLPGHGITSRQVGYCVTGRTKAPGNFVSLN
jgi:hypothetical protein